MDDSPLTLDERTRLWVLEAKVKAYELALAQSVESDKAQAEACIELAAELHWLKEGVRGFALTLRDWAVAAGGHTPSAIIASRLLDLIGDGSEPPTAEQAPTKP